VPVVSRPAEDLRVLHLPTLTEPARQAWFDRREPAEHRADWWRCLSHGAAGKTDGADETAARWARLRRALVRAAGERSALPTAEAAVTEVGLLAEAADDALPVAAADDAVARWLATTADLPADLAVIDIPTARRLRDQIHVVARGAGLLTDACLAGNWRDG
jgi:hypothetical protein